MVEKDIMEKVEEILEDFDKQVDPKVLWVRLDSLVAQVGILNAETLHDAKLQFALAFCQYASTSLGRTLGYLSEEEAQEPRRLVRDLLQLLMGNYDAVDPEQWKDAIAKGLGSDTVIKSG